MITLREEAYERYMAKRRRRLERLQARLSVPGLPATEAGRIGKMIETEFRKMRGAEERFAKQQGED